MALPQPKPAELDQSELTAKQEATIDDIMNSIRDIIAQDQNQNQPVAPPKSHEVSNNNIANAAPLQQQTQEIASQPTSQTAETGELEQTLERLMLPLLKDWLAENLPQTIERAVERAVEKAINEEIELIRQNK